MTDVDTGTPALDVAAPPPVVTGLGPRNGSAVHDVARELAGDDHG